MEERHGFIRDELDVKLLILFVMNLVETPVNAQTVYELCYQDECLSYFDVIESLPQMVESGHLEQTEDGLYTITEKGRETEELTSNAIAFTVRQRAKHAAEQLNRKNKRDQFLRSRVEQRGENEFIVHMGLDDANGSLMELQITAPTLQRARKLEKAYWENAEIVYQTVMLSLMEEFDGEEE